MSDPNDPDPPAYQEAYPSLDLSEAARRRDVDRISVHWKNPHGFLAAHGKLTWTSLSKLEVEYEIINVPFLARGESRATLSIEWPLRGRFYKPSVHCRSCGDLTGKLFLKGSDWLCTTCQGLYPRRRLLPRLVRLSEDLMSLYHEVGDGRPDGMRHSEYLKKRDQLNALRRELGITRAKASPRFRSFLYAEWHPETVEKVKSVATPPVTPVIPPWIHRGLPED